MQLSGSILNQPGHDKAFYDLEKFQLVRESRGRNMGSFATPAMESIHGIMNW